MGIESEAGRRNEFVWSKLLGRGSFGEVHSVTRVEDGEQYVIKTIGISPLDRTEQEEAIREVQLLAAVDHPRIVRYLDSFCEAGKLFIVMEFCEGGDLHNFLAAQKGALLHERQVWSFFMQTAAGLDHLHALKILHRDIKTRNLFLSDRGLKIGDLGVARLLGTSAEFASTLVGTPYYLSPELCENEPYNASADVWALGVVLHELLCAGELPFKAHNQAALVLRIVRGHREAPPRSYSSLVRGVLDRCLNQTAALRPSCAELLVDDAIAAHAASLGLDTEWGGEHAGADLGADGADGEAMAQTVEDEELQDERWAAQYDEETGEEAEEAEEAEEVAEAEEVTDGEEVAEGKQLEEGEEMPAPVEGARETRASALASGAPSLQGGAHANGAAARAERAVAIVESGRPSARRSAVAAPQNTPRVGSASRPKTGPNAKGGEKMAGLARLPRSAKGCRTAATSSECRPSGGYAKTASISQFSSQQAQPSQLASQPLAGAAYGARGVRRSARVDSAVAGNRVRRSGPVGSERAVGGVSDARLGAHEQRRRQEQQRQQLRREAAQRAHEAQVAATERQLAEQEARLDHQRKMAMLAEAEAARQARPPLAIAVAPIVASKDRASESERVRPTVQQLQALALAAHEAAGDLGFADEDGALDTARHQLHRAGETCSDDVPSYIPSDRPGEHSSHEHDPSHADDLEATLEAATLHASELAPPRPSDPLEATAMETSALTCAEAGWVAGPRVTWRVLEATAANALSVSEAAQEHTAPTDTDADGDSD